VEVNQVLGLDVGMVRTGIARASTVARLAEPLMGVDTAKLIECLDKLIKLDSVETIVVGLPRNLKGDDTAQTAWVRDWVVKNKDKLGPTFYWQDEALTTKAAELRQHSSKNPLDIDALAAAIILQDFLDTPEADRVVC
jgi:putative Holliday junction resolvase